mmetsp:Transcript_102792/g.286296  ORF Transcript_102792/g.286296 Transcript_102792/m.286296 type:complete len:232 (-) Transcript_102792:176-871(-)
MAWRWRRACPGGCRPGPCASTTSATRAWSRASRTCAPGAAPARRTASRTSCGPRLWRCWTTSRTRASPTAGSRPTSRATTGDACSLGSTSGCPRGSWSRGCRRRGTSASWPGARSGTASAASTWTGWGPSRAWTSARRPGPWRRSLRLRRAMSHMEAPLPAPSIIGTGPATRTRRSAPCCASPTQPSTCPGPPSRSARSCGTWSAAAGPPTRSGCWAWRPWSPREAWTPLR